MKDMVIQQDFAEVLTHIKQAKQKVYTQINSTLIELYWNIGRTISQKVKSENWGKGVVRELSLFILQNDPTVKGFSDKNLWRMKQFYETYSEDEKLSPLVREYIAIQILSAVPREFSWQFFRYLILPFALSLSKGGFMVRQAHHERTGKSD